MNQLLKSIATLFTILLSTIFLIVVIEGIASVCLTFYDVALAEKEPSYTGYDADLGWVSQPNLKLADFYGPGKEVVTNSLGFRNNAEFHIDPTSDQLGILCSGDSFTFGAGVSNGETWCDLLSEYDSINQTGNLGVSGYSIGQSMLRYESSTADISHTLHIFAFIRSDILRTNKASHNGYGRPITIVHDGELVIENVPVPELSNTVVRNLQVIKGGLRSVELLRSIRDSLDPGTGHTAPADLISNIEKPSIEIFKRVDNVTRSRGAVAVFVLLPGGVNNKPDQWDVWLTSTMQVLELPFLNLSEDIREIPEDLAKSYFIPIGEPGQTHYNQSGNRWASETLYHRLVQGGYISGSNSGVSVLD